MKGRRRSSVKLNKLSQLRNTRGSVFMQENQMKHFFGKKNGKGDDNKQVSRKNLDKKNRSKYNGANY